MINRIKTAVAALSLVAAVPLSATRIHAATPDGMGPWADTVVSTTQGLRKDGSAVPLERSDATSMLGVAEGDTVTGHFYSLGFGGTATLGFDNGISNGVIVVEATPVGDLVETAKVEVSTNGTDFVQVGTVNSDGQVTLPADAGCVKWVRLTDTTDPTNFSPTADGYDVDGVQARGDVCTTSGKMTGGGSLWSGDKRVTHGMQLRCDGSKGNLQINWGKGNKFHLENLEYALCTDNPALDPKNPSALFDTFYGHGTGKYNGTSGYHVYFTFTDNGEPGTGDQGTITVWDPTMTTKVLDLPMSYLKNGNHQAH